MTVEHSFGGPWTERKLKCLRDYLSAYRAIFTGNPRARYFRTWYVDAFAGTGSRSTVPGDTPLLDIYDDTETQQYQEGSAKIAIGLPSPFDNYLFIEKSRRRVGELQSVIQSEFSQLHVRCEFLAGDANAQLNKWCAARDWSKERAVVFLDPYGMQVDWTTVVTLAGTKGVDLWYLFPGIARVLRRDGDIPEAWKNRLDALFGTSAWQSRFFEKKRGQDLFGDIESVERIASETAIEGFIHERLATCFGKNVGRSLILRNSKSSPLYFLCFAASNERGARAALNIANSILGN
jgi:three-Cys-motif partner protein